MYPEEKLRNINRTVSSKARQIEPDSNPIKLFIRADSIGGFPVPPERINLPYIIVLDRVQ
jgi:hypothetical protein